MSAPATVSANDLLEHLETFKAIKELIDLGYIEQSRDADGKIRYHIARPAEEE